MDEEIKKQEPIKNNFTANPEVNIFASTNFRNQQRKFGIKLDDRRRHMYVVGKTGMGKTTMLENMVLNDIYAGHGVGVVDPHGDFAEKIINYIPAHRINDVVYFNPADLNYPIGFNILEMINPDHKHLVASGLMGVFKKIWVDMWSSRMEYILNNTILALLDFPNTTLLGINRLLSDADYRKRVVQTIKDPVVKSFWNIEFASYNDRYRQEAVAPIQNKIGQFLSASVIRNIVAQVKSKIDIRNIMDERKIFIMNLSKGRIGEDNSKLLGGMLITKIQLAAMERVDTPEAERADFFLYVDEFQNFATESFSHILSEARKYHLGLIMAHQYMEQLDETVLAAVLGNVGTISTFRVGSTDSEVLAKEFAPVFLEEDLINLPKYNIYLKLMIEGVASRPFSADTLPPIGYPTDSFEKIVKVSRERYAVAREDIEDKIMSWSGMGSSEEKIEPQKKVNDYSQSKYNAKADQAQKKSPQQNKNKNSNEGKNNNRNNNKRNDGERNKGQQNSKDKNFNPQEIKKVEKVSVVDISQKGISLSDAMKNNYPAKFKKREDRSPENKPKAIESKPRIDNSSVAEESGSGERKKENNQNKNINDTNQKRMVLNEEKASESKLKIDQQDKPAVRDGQSVLNQQKKIESKEVRVGEPKPVSNNSSSSVGEVKTLRPDEVVKFDQDYDDAYRYDI